MVDVQPAAGPDARIAVAVIAPGAGTGINGAVYQNLNREPRFKVEIVGRSRAQYDCYPPNWPHGGPAPNLESFAAEVLAQRVVERNHCLVFGSRGGQVVLPYFWKAQAQGLLKVPPAFIINGGCAMNIPDTVKWPHDAITFLLIGGQDNFRGHFTTDQYVSDTQGHVPKQNSTTAILYVHEMVHMPQMNLLNGCIQYVLRALMAWQSVGKPPLEHFRAILGKLSRDGWSGRLLYTSAPGAWEDIKFSRTDVGKLPAAPVAEPEMRGPMLFTQKDELKALWRAAITAAKPPPAPQAPPPQRAVAAPHPVVNVPTAASPQVTSGGVTSPPKPKPALMLPIPVAGQRAAVAEVQDPRTPKSYSEVRTPGGHEVRTPKAYNEVRTPGGHNLQVPLAARTPGGRNLDPTPISAALGLGYRQGFSPCTPAYTGFFADSSPTHRPVPVAVWA